MLVPTGRAVRLSANLSTSLSFFWNMGLISLSSQDGQKHSREVSQGRMKAWFFLLPCPTSRGDLPKLYSPCYGVGVTDQPDGQQRQRVVTGDWKSGRSLEGGILQGLCCCGENQGAPQRERSLYLLGLTETERRRTKTSQGIKNKHALRTTWLRLHASTA